MVPETSEASILHLNRQARDSQNKGRKKDQGLFR